MILGRRPVLGLIVAIGLVLGGCVAAPQAVATAPPATSAASEVTASPVPAVQPTTGSTDAASAAYRLTATGRALEPAIHALGRWGWGKMGKPRSADRRNIDWLLVALRRRYRGGVTLTATIEADGAPYHIVLRGARAEIGRGAAPASDLRVTGKGQDIARLFLDGLPGPDPLTVIDVQGDARLLPTLVDAFARGDAEPGSSAAAAGASA